MGLGNQLTGFLKDRDNPEKFGAMVGVMVSIKPFVVSVLNGKVLIDKNLCLASKTIKEMCKEYTESCEVKADLEIQPYSVNATFNGGSGILNITEAKKDYKAKIKQENVLKVGDKVLVVASESNNFYYVIDKLEVVE